MGKVGSLRWSLISNRAIIEPVNRPLELLQAEKQTGGAGEEHVLEWGEPFLLAVSIACLLCIDGQVRALGVDQEPHGIELLGARQRARVLALQLFQAMLKPWLIGQPFTSHEDKAVEHHALANNGNVLEGFLEDDEDMAMHPIRIRNPPQVEPVRVYLVVSDQHQAL